jgi:hypothetical protein
MKEKTYNNETVLYELYVNKEMSQKEVGELLGCSARTVGRKLEKYNIKSRGFGGSGVAKASYVKCPRGYRKASCSKYDDMVYIHQLVVISDGESPYDLFSGENETHHKNSIKWDNRPQNLELLSRLDHQKKHK